MNDEKLGNVSGVMDEATMMQLRMISVEEGINFLKQERAKMFSEMEESRNAILKTVEAVNKIAGIVDTIKKIVNEKAVNISENTPKPEESAWESIKNTVVSWMKGSDK